MKMHQVWHYGFSNEHDKVQGVMSSTPFPHKALLQLWPFLRESPEALRGWRLMLALLMLHLVLPMASCKKVNPLSDGWPCTWGDSLCYSASLRIECRNRQGQGSVPA